MKDDRPQYNANMYRITGQRNGFHRNNCGIMLVVLTERKATIKTGKPAHKR